MAIWNDETLALYREQAERELSNEVPHIFKRYTLAVQQGVSKYDLPDEIISILFITYKGKTVFPTTKRELDAINCQISPNDSSTGTPRNYIILDEGRNKIKFHPAPNETITADDSALTSIDNYINKVVIGAYIESDQDDDDYRTPSFMRRRLVKHYINYRSYLSENKNQRVEAALYYKNRWENAIQALRIAFDNVFKTCNPSMTPTIDDRKHPARPILPPEFGRKVR